MLDLLVENLHIAFATVIGCIGIIVFSAFRRRTQIIAERVRKMKPFEVFLREVSKEQVDQRRVRLLFDPKIYEEVEFGTVKTMCRCIADSVGSFIKFKASTASLSIKKDPARKLDGIRYHASAVCEFTKNADVKCDVSWRISPGSSTAHVVSFSVKPAGSELEVFAHVDPRDFESFGEKFIARMLSKDPSAAVNMMASPLKGKYEDPSKITQEMKRAIAVIGGFKGKTIDIDLSDARRVKVGPQERQRSAIELDFMIQGNIRDLKATICIIFVGVKAQVLRYTFTGLAVKQQLAFVDENGHAQ